MNNKFWAIFRIKNLKSDKDPYGFKLCNEESIVGVCPSLDYARAYMNYNQDKLKDGETFIAIEVNEL